MTGVSKDAILKLMVELGEACADYHDKNVRGLTSERIQADEAWAFVGAKKYNKPGKRAEQGDIWTWIALDADTKLVVSVVVRPRSPGACHDFVQDLAERVPGRFQLTSDALRLYAPAVEEHLCARVDYAQVIKVYGRS